MISDYRLLYVEDNEIVRDNFVEIFSRYFKNITTADNGKKALELYEKNKFDIAILDISIPEINGLNVAAKIREKDEKIKIIMLSAYSDQEKLLKAVNLQLFSYLIKPVKYQELDRTLKKVITKLSDSSIINLNYGYSWDKNKKSLNYNSSEVKTSKNERALVELLLSYPDRHFSACEISNEILNHNDDGDCNNITQLISRFKKKMLNLCDKEHFFIDNIYGLGYKITQ